MSSSSGLVEHHNQQSCGMVANDQHRYRHNITSHTQMHSHAVHLSC